MMVTANPPFVLLDTASGEQIPGSSRSDLVDTVVPGHGDLPEGEEGAAARFDLRTVALVEVAHRLQGLALSDVDTSTLDEDALTVLFHDRGTEVVDLAEWPEDLPPLFVIASNYAPYSESPRPTGDVVFLDAFNEKTFLDSLAAAGVVEVYELETDDPELAEVEDAFA